MLLIVGRIMRKNEKNTEKSKLSNMHELLFYFIIQYSHYEHKKELFSMSEDITLL